MLGAFEGSLVGTRNSSIEFTPVEFTIVSLPGFIALKPPQLWPRYSDCLLRQREGQTALLG
ncbi:hypothetical protein [Rhizobium sp. 32_C3_N1_1]|jgi:hypothetical protein|uniref:hypothetical protein n=1 Tax=Rhizobium sp. 32_C3_N1_1 TaxID=3240771 RepID=UPI003F2146E9